jgi:hypothetical protein
VSPIFFLFPPRVGDNRGLKTIRVPVFTNITAMAKIDVL